MLEAASHPADDDAEADSATETLEDTATIELAALERELELELESIEQSASSQRQPVTSSSPKASQIPPEFAANAIVKSSAGDGQTAGSGAARQPAAAVARRRWRTILQRQPKNEPLTSAPAVPAGLKASAESGPVTDVSSAAAALAVQSQPLTSLSVPEPLQAPPATATATSTESIEALPAEPGTLHAAAPTLQAATVQHSKAVGVPVDHSGAAGKTDIDVDASVGQALIAATSDTRSGAEAQEVSKDEALQAVALTETQQLPAKALDGIQTSKAEREHAFRRRFSFRNSLKEAAAVPALLRQVSDFNLCLERTGCS